MSFLVDGELESRTGPTAMVFSCLPKVAAWTYTAASPALRSVWRHRCGRCRPLCEMDLLKSSSAGANVARSLNPQLIGKDQFRQDQFGEPERVMAVVDNQSCVRLQNHSKRKVCDHGGWDKP